MGELHRIECPLAEVNNQKYARKTKPEEQSKNLLASLWRIPQTMFASQPG